MQSYLAVISSGISLTFKIVAFIEMRATYSRELWDFLPNFKNVLPLLSQTFIGRESMQRYIGNASAKISILLAY